MTADHLLTPGTADVTEAQWPRTEYIDGSRHVSPYPGLRHQMVVGELYHRLRSAAPASVLVLPGANIVQSEATLVIPDVVAAPREAVHAGSLGLEPSQVLLAVEVESLSTRRVDRTLKRSLYEEWGVAYLLVNPATETVAAFGDVPTWAGADRLEEIFDAVR
jgi:Uma2 family endonuclease